MRFSHLPISLRVPLIAAALMVLVGAVASQQVLAALGRVQDARLRELTRLHIDGLSVALGPNVLRKDIWEVYDTLNRASTATDGKRMVLTVVADEAGRVLAATDPRRAPVDSDIAALSDGAQRLEDISIDGSTGHIRVAAPLDYQGRAVGRIVTELDVSDLVQERWQASLYLLIGNAAVTLLLAVGGYLAMRRMLQPIATLSRHMSDAEGAPTPIPPSELPRGDTEFAHLFRTYNSMTGAVEAKAEAERRLAERERFVSLGRLSSSLAHEINNPLGGLLNATDTIQTYADRPDVVRASSALLERGLKHLRDVVRATLEQNRVERQGIALGPSDFDDLNLLFAPEVNLLGQSLDWKVEVSHTALARFPSAPLRQIALNLLLNASAAAGRGGHIGLSVMETAEGLQLKVRDTGPGMPAAGQVRLLTSDPVPPGGGVGLRLVRDLIMGLGGQVLLARIEAQTVITVNLPAKEA